jgi:hypothetical protein
MKRSQKLQNESGVALFICLFALLLLTSIGLGLMYMANTETAINYNYRSSVQAFYAARGGAMEAVDRLRQGDTAAGYSITPPTTMPTYTASTGVVYILNPAAGETVAPWDPNNAYFDDELCHEQFLDSAGNNALGIALSSAGVPCLATVNPAGSVYYTTTTSQLPYASTTPYKWARITLKQNATATPYVVDSSSPNKTKICWDGSHEIALPTGYADCGIPPAGSNPYSPVYVVTAMASAQAGGTGRARRMYQMEYAPAPPVNVTSAVASYAGVNLTGQLTVNGYDQCTCKTVTSGNTTTYNNPRVPGGTCDTSKMAIYSAGQVDNPNASETVVAGTGPIVQNVGSSWPSSLNVPSLINQFKPSSVNVATCSNGSCTLNSGTNVMGPIVNISSSSFDPTTISTAGQVSYVGGSITFNGGGGSGILIVDGDLTIHGGGFQWYGLILVRGTVTFQGGGSAGTNIEGAVISGQDANANVDTTLGGSVVINLDKCAVTNSLKGQPLVYLSSRELLY